MLKLVIAAIFIPSILFACETCAVYNSLDNQRRLGNDTFLGIAYDYQLSDSDSTPDLLALQGLSGETQSIESHTTQIFANYFFDERNSIQINLPFIYRDFRRFDGNSYVSGSEEGIGDISLLYKYIPWQKYYSKFNYRSELYAGLKLPTGDSDRLTEVEIDTDERSLFRHGGPDGSLVGGDHLALGSGSYDFILGGGIYSQYERFLLNFAVQAFLRTEGDHDYQFGNEINWFLSGGYYLWIEKAHSLAFNLRFSGQSKGQDEINGSRLADSQEFNLFLGPEIILSMGRNLIVQFAADFAVENDDSETEVAARRRFLSALTYRF